MVGCFWKQVPGLFSLGNTIAGLHYGFFFCCILDLEHCLCYPLTLTAKVSSRCVGSCGSLFFIFRKIPAS